MRKNKIVLQKIQTHLKDWLNYYSREKFFTFHSIREEHTLELIDIINEHCESIAELRSLYRWMGLSTDFFSQGDFIAYRSFNHFMIIYERENRHYFLFFKLILDFLNCSKDKEDYLDIYHRRNKNPVY